MEEFPVVCVVESMGLSVICGVMVELVGLLLLPGSCVVVTGTSVIGGKVEVSLRPTLVWWFKAGMATAR